MNVLRGGSENLHIKSSCPKSANRPNVSARRPFYGLADLELPFYSLFPLTLRVAVAAEHNKEVGITHEDFTETRRSSSLCGHNFIQSKCVTRSRLNLDNLYQIKKEHTTDAERSQGITC